MATFSLGGGVTPGAPGVYINEQAGLAASAAVADFSTVYMLVETEDDVPVTKFPFNVPIAITSLEDYEELIRVGNQTVPESRIPLLSYNCVNEFFQNAQVGDLRVVRVGTPNQIVEIEFLPSGTKLNATDLPSALEAGDTFYVQLILNGLKLVAGDGSTGYTSSGEWLGVPVVAPVNYIAGDEANNRKISAAIVTAVSTAIESNPAVRGSVYVRDSGLVNDLDPSGNSQNGYVTIAATTYDAGVSVVSEAIPVGATYVLMQNGYDVENIVGGSVQLERTPEDYAQCITTAFDGQQDQGYLITPTAYAQFDTEGRVYVGQIATEHCASNSYKWMALADPGPFLITDVNKYSDYVPHKPAADLDNGLSYLVDNAIYKWIGNDISYNKLDKQNLIRGADPEIAVRESANLVSDGEQVGLLDTAIYTIAADAPSANGRFTLTTGVWPVELPIQKVTLSGADGAVNEFRNVSIQGGATGVDLEGTEVFLVAAPYDTVNTGSYPLNFVFMALTAGDATNIYNTVVLAGGGINISAPPNGAVFIPGAPVGDTAMVSYGEPYWDLPVEINGQTSDLIENISGEDVGVNTLHLPGTLQDPTSTYVLSFKSRLFTAPSTQIVPASGITGIADNTAVFTCIEHGFRSGQVAFFTNPIKYVDGGETTTLVGPSTAQVLRPFVVKLVDANTFVLADGIGNYTNGVYITMPATAVCVDHTSTIYSQLLGRGENDIEDVALVTVPLVRGRKYAFDSNSIFDQSLSSNITPSGGSLNGLPGISIYLNNSSSILGVDQITPYGEDISDITKCGYLPKFNLVSPTLTPEPLVTNAFTTPTLAQFFSSESYVVPAQESVQLAEYNAGVPGTIGPALTLTIDVATCSLPNNTYNNIELVTNTGTGSGVQVSLQVAAGLITSVLVTSQGQGYVVGDSLQVPATFGSGLGEFSVASINDAGGSVQNTDLFGVYNGLVDGWTAAQVDYFKAELAGGYFTVVGSGVGPGGEAVSAGDRYAITYENQTFRYTVVPPDADGGDMSTVATVLNGAGVELTYSPETLVPQNLWRFDAITSTEIIDNALRGVGFNGEPQAEFVEAGIDNVNRMYADSQRYGNAQGFVAYYGPYIENGAGQFIPPSAYVTGVALRRYRSEGYQFPPAGVKYQLTDALGVQIPINSAQQNLLNPDGCNVVRTLPGYPTNAVYIWGGRTRLTNPADAQQKLYQFVNTRVILNVVYGSLRNAFDSQIFNVIDGFGVIYNQIISVGNSVLNQLYVRGALFGAKPSAAFQVICDNRINSSENLENGIVNAKVFVTPVPTLERIQIDLIRVAIGKMGEELDLRGLGSNNS